MCEGILDWLLKKINLLKATKHNQIDDPPPNSHFADQSPTRDFNECLQNYTVIGSIRAALSA